MQWSLSDSTEQCDVSLSEPAERSPCTVINVHIVHINDELFVKLDVLLLQSVVCATLFDRACSFTLKMDPS
jgi:hypothetical protein